MPAIAAEKAGIIKVGSPVVTGCRDAEALAVITGAARQRGAEVWTVADAEAGFHPGRYTSPHLQCLDTASGVW
ncbi:MAG: hypothetical protein AB1445_04405 [Bacillota bacterium]